MKEFPKCEGLNNRCAWTDWRRVSSRNDRDVFIDTYECRNPMHQRPWPMSWAYTKPEDQLGGEMIVP